MTVDNKGAMTFEAERTAARKESRPGQVKTACWVEHNGSETESP